MIIGNGNMQTAEEVTGDSLVRYPGSVQGTELPDYSLSHRQVYASWISHQVLNSTHFQFD